MRVRPKMQVDANQEVISYAKALAYSRNQSLTEYVLRSMALNGDKKLKELIEKDLSSRAKPGNPAKPKSS